MIDIDLSFYLLGQPQTVADKTGIEANVSIASRSWGSMMTEDNEVDQPEMDQPMNQRQLDAYFGNIRVLRFLVRKFYRDVGELQKDAMSFFSGEFIDYPDLFPKFNKLRVFLLQTILQHASAMRSLVQQLPDRQVPL